MVLIGAGQVSRELAPVWKQAGHDILQVISRTEASARPLGEQLGCPWTTHLVDAAGALADAHVVVLGFGADPMPRGLRSYGADVPRVMTSPIFVDVDGNGVFDAPGGKECSWTRTFEAGAP